MKIRNGFISNSSSCSFIISEKTYKSQCIGEIAYLMLEQHIKKTSTDKEYYKKIDIQERTKALKWLENNLFYNKPIMIPWTCNYETWIFRNNKNKILINTCNNEDWTMLKEFGFDYCDDDSAYEEKEKYKDLKFLDLSDIKLKTYDEFWDERKKLWGTK